MNIKEYAHNQNISVDEARIKVETAILDYAELSDNSEYWYEIADTLTENSEIASAIAQRLGLGNNNSNTAQSGGMGQSAITSVEEGLENSVVLGATSLEDTKNAQIQLDLATAEAEGSKVGYLVGLTRFKAQIQAQRRINELTSHVNNVVDAELDQHLFNSVAETLVEMQQMYSETCEEVASKKKQATQSKEYAENAASRILGLRDRFFKKAQ